MIKIALKRSFLPFHTANNFWRSFISDIPIFEEAKYNFERYIRKYLPTGYTHYDFDDISVGLANLFSLHDDIINNDNRQGLFLKFIN